MSEAEKLIEGLRGKKDSEQTTPVDRDQAMRTKGEPGYGECCDCTDCNGCDCFDCSQD